MYFTFTGDETEQELADTAAQHRQMAESRRLLARATAVRLDLDTPALPDGSTPAYVWVLIETLPSGTQVWQGVEV